MAMTLPAETETDRVRRIQDKAAPKYDRQISFFERVLFEDGREWACSRAEGDVLEIAVGTGRNLPYYRDAGATGSSAVFTHRRIAVRI